MARLVVGVDGSEASLAALRFAVEEAGRRGPDTVIEAVLAFDAVPYVPGMEMGYVAPPPLDRLEAEAERVLLEALSKVDTGGLSVDDIVIADTPAHALVEQSRGADLCILGKRGHSRLSSLLLGSVSTRVASHATCPVVIIHPE